MLIFKEISAKAIFKSCRIVKEFYVIFQSNPIQIMQVQLDSNIFQVMVFDKSVSPVIQLNVIEPYDMMIARVERHRGGEGGKLIVFKLSDLEEFLADLLEWHHHVDNLLHRSLRKLF